jgi:hypothetical protein
VAASTAALLFAEFDKERPVPRLSIVIPCLGGAAEFDGTLVSVLQNRPADCEVLVVHTAAYDDPYQLGEEVQFLRASSRSLVELINSACQHATGEIVHLVGCGLEVTESWTEAALVHFGDPEVAAVTPLVLGADRQTVAMAGLRWSLGGARRVVTDQRLLSQGTGRLRASILGPALAAAFYRRDVLAALDGFDRSAGDELADVDFALAIQSLGRLHVCEPASRLIQMSGESLAPRSGGFIGGRAAERLFWQHAAARGLISSLAFHPVAVLADIARRLPSPAAMTSLLGRTVAVLEAGSRRQREQRLAAAADRLAELAEQRTTVRLPIERQPRPKATPQPERRRAA